MISKEIEYNLHYEVTALPRHHEKEETDNSKLAQIKQMS